MSGIRTIKGVDDETWASFKSVAAKNDMKMGAMLKKMVKGEKEREGRAFWDEILNRKPLLSEKEADELLEYTQKLRKENWFRK